MLCDTSGSSVVVECCTVSQTPRGTGFKTRLEQSFFFFFSFSFFLSSFYGSVTETLVAHHKFIVLSPIKGAWRNNLRGSGTIILKAVFSVH